MAIIGDVDRYRACPTEKKRAVGQNQQERNDERADPLQVSKRIQRKASFILGSGVAQEMACPSMCRLVTRDGENEPYDRKGQSKGLYLSHPLLFSRAVSIHPKILSLSGWQAPRKTASLPASSHRPTPLPEGTPLKGKRSTPDGISR